MGARPPFLLPFLSYKSVSSIYTPDTHKNNHYSRMRNTPTSVGKTSSSLRCSCMTWKHPHERGEDSYAKPTRSALIETPPRAWGRRRVLEWRQKQSGNTPTSVGKTGCQRMSGLWYLETPPRAWGRLSVAYRECLFHWKHPHERGEDDYKISA